MKRYQITRKVFYEEKIEANSKEEAQEKFNKWMDFCKFSDVEDDVIEVQLN